MIKEKSWTMAPTMFLVSKMKLNIFDIFQSLLYFTSNKGLSYPMAGKPAYQTALAHLEGAITQGLHSILEKTSPFRDDAHHTVLAQVCFLGPPSPLTPCFAGEGK